MFYFCFNAFPSYDDVDSWEGTVKSLSSLCCMGAALGGSATVGGRCAGACFRPSAGRLSSRLVAGALLRTADPLLAGSAAIRWQGGQDRRGLRALLVAHLWLTLHACCALLQRAGGVAGNRQVTQPAVWRHRHGPHG